MHHILVTNMRSFYDVMTSQLLSLGTWRCHSSIKRSIGEGRSLGYKLKMLLIAQVHQDVQSEHEQHHYRGLHHQLHQRVSAGYRWRIASLKPVPSDVFGKVHRCSNLNQETATYILALLFPIVHNRIVNYLYASTSSIIMAESILISNSSLFFNGWSWSLLFGNELLIYYGPSILMTGIRMFVFTYIFTRLTQSSSNLRIVVGFFWALLRFL